ncbi:MAG: class II fumarate hydratase [Candidatus Obscuribacterales bacterium]|nr:class II fumarate hydratase [Candidatus Obscuribacterales bacterium]
MSSSKTSGNGGKQRFRTETDSMGEVKVPVDALYGATTQRALINFPISGHPMPLSFIRAVAAIKASAAEANAQLELLERRIAFTIVQAAEEIIAGKHAGEFPIDVYQTGSGTSTNMNVNEVIAARARQILGADLTNRDAVHPNDHVNRCQSSNDVIPTATHVAASLLICRQLLPALTKLEKALKAKEKQFARIVKTGRTHLQDATPITLGQEFSGYAAQVANAIRHVKYARTRLSFVALGGTAVGTGINAHPQFARLALARLSERLGIRFSEAPNHFQAQSTLDEVVLASGALKTAAVTLMKIANDIRHLGSGPRAGLGELNLPEVQPGSSIMPGKVNPVIAESLAMVCAKVIGNDATIAVAGQSGLFELNVMQPVAAVCLIESIELLANSADNFRIRLVDGLTATDRGPQLVEEGLMLATALTPALGYDKAAAIAHEAATTGETIRQVAQRLSGLSQEELDKLLDPLSMVTNKPRRKRRK